MFGHSDLCLATPNTIWCLATPPEEVCSTSLSSPDHQSPQHFGQATRERGEFLSRLHNPICSQERQRYFCFAVHVHQIQHGNKSVMAGVPHRARRQVGILGTYQILLLLLQVRPLLTCEDREVQFQQHPQRAARHQYSSATLETFSMDPECPLFVIWQGHSLCASQFQS